MYVTKPYKFTGFGAMDVTKPCKFTEFGAMDVTKPYKFTGFGAMDVSGGRRSPRGANRKPNKVVISTQRHAFTVNHPEVQKLLFLRVGPEIVDFWG